MEGIVTCYVYKIVLYFVIQNRMKCEHTLQLNLIYMFQKIRILLLYNNRLQYVTRTL